MAEIAPSETRSRRPSTGATNDSRSATLSAARTPSSQVTVRPPASSSQSSREHADPIDRAIGDSEEHHHPVRRSSRMARAPVPPGARVAIDVPSADGFEPARAAAAVSIGADDVPVDPCGVAAEAAHDALAVDDRHFVAEPGDISLARHEGAERLRERRSRGLGRDPSVGNPRLLGGDDHGDGERRRGDECASDDAVGLSA